MTAHNWRTLRDRYQDKGIADPMALPSMHSILDRAESLALESAASGAKTQTEARQKISALYDRLYKPDLTEQTSIINGRDEELMRPPPGFEDDEVEASFDAFVSSANSR